MVVFPRHVTWEPVSIASLAPCPRPASPLCSRPGCSVGFGHGAGCALQHQRRHRGLPVSQAALAGDHLSLSCYTRGGSYISTRVMILPLLGTGESGGILHMHLVFKRIWNISFRGGIWLQSQLPSTRVYGDYPWIIAINSSFSVNNRTRSAAECHPY